jgi:outer membrane protein assembly factor BamA
MIVPGLSVAGELAYQKSRTAAGTSDESPTVGEIFESEDATGYSENIEHRIVGTRLALDLRDVANNPRSGIGVFIDHTLFDDSDSDRFSYQSTSTEFQGYLPFLHKHRVFALRVRAATTQGREGGDVPFYHLPYIGGGQSVRGFREYRFRDRRQLLANLEYRFEAFIGCDVALFADAGQVGDSWDVFTFEDFVTSNGVGLRFNTYQNVFLRLDLAHGKEGTRFLFKFENAF